MENSRTDPHRVYRLFSDVLFIGGRVLVVVDIALV
jgi:hypothetical protein